MRHFVLVGLFFLMTLSGCWSGSDSKPGASNNTSKGDQGASNATITGAYGWVLGTTVPDTLKCEKDPDCGDTEPNSPLTGVMELQSCKCWQQAKEMAEYDKHSGAYNDCKSLKKETVPDDWIMKICVSPKSKTIFKVLVSAVGLDSTGMTGLVSKLSEKYGTAKDETIGGMVVGKVFKSGRSTLTVHQRGLVEMIYANTDAVDLAMKELRQLQDEAAQKTKETLSTGGL